MNSNWHKSYRQMEDERKDKMNFRNSLASGLIAITLIGVASCIADKHQINKYDPNSNTYTNRYQRVIQ